MRKLWKNRPLWFALGLFVLCILLAGYTMGDSRISYADGLFRSAALPVQERLYAAEDAVRGFFLRVFNPSALEAENAELQQKLNEQAMLLAFYEDTARENARLSELLNFTDANPQLRFLTAEVIARSSNPYIDTLTLNVGTLANDDMRISIMVQRTRDEGMYGGLLTLSDGTLGGKLYYLPDEADVRVGDVIVTSGLPQSLVNAFTAFTNSRAVVLLLINVLFLIIGMLMEANAAVVMMVPILTPLLNAFGVDLLHFGIFMNFNLCIGLVTPPVGLCLLISDNIAESGLSKTMKSLMPMLLIAIVVLFLVTYIPALTTWLPSLMK